MSAQVQSHQSSKAAGIAGLCFLACIAIGALAYLSALFRVYGPPFRAWLIDLAYAANEWMAWLTTPQFVLGMFFMALVLCLGAALIAWGERR